MAINWEKYDTEVRNDIAIKRNQIFLHFMQRTFHRQDGLNLREICLLIDVIMQFQTRKKSAEENKKLNREKMPERK